MDGSRIVVWTFSGYYHHHLIHHSVDREGGVFIPRVGRNEMDLALADRIQRAPSGGMLDSKPSGASLRVGQTSSSTRSGFSRSIAARSVGSL
ncbi:hypothetical protein [Cohnella faecalis]|uniref:Uncharacterized protein n=1 Tax=Cohnella faecalis TaxID=2315694 RepID=A0A398CD07_9BACL|nr:hypothetical protein [Cohnella faecalis]RIE01066.1 hypothetical protein D3H35_21825 [Cohnella faecalis]